MTQLLERALKQVKTLPVSKQSGIATLILDELEDERRWDEAFSKSKRKLARMSAKIDKDIAKGRVSAIGFDEL
ncbi:MAG TPA: hypothetical protein VKX17_22735 [Planctomycetota bacterium]|nr:hypothetical protein [Planctomycetota bacterium]